jgi:hypothetical protein
MLKKQDAEIVKTPLKTAAIAIPIKMAGQIISEITFRHIVHFVLACGGFTLMIRGITSLI